MHLIDFYFKISISISLIIFIYINKTMSSSHPVVLWHGMGKKYE